MADVRYVKRVPTREEFMALRIDAGWGLAPTPILSDSLQKTLFAVCAETEEAGTVGMARVVGDGGLQLFVTDVIVNSEWRRRGIGTEMMRLITEHIKELAPPNAFVGLFSARGLEPFYERFGFVARPTDTMGAGMILSRKKNEEQHTAPFDIIGQGSV